LITFVLISPDDGYMIYRFHSLNRVSSGTAEEGRRWVSQQIKVSKEIQPTLCLVLRLLYQGFESRSWNRDCVEKNADTSQLEMFDLDIGLSVV